MKKLIIFDLDGTLLNTIADLAQSTNHALQALGYPTHPESAYNFMVGNGINKLFERALPEGEKSEENVLRVRKEFVPYYDVHNADKRLPLPRHPRTTGTVAGERDDIGSGFQQISIGYRETDFTLFPQHTFYRRLRTTGRGQREARPNSGA